MRTLRLLVWLRWKLFLRSGTTGSRVAGLVFTLLLLVAFSPAWLGGAFAAYAGVLGAGAPVEVVVFGVCQLAWVSLGLLSGALGRTFDLDKFLRYPVRPHTVYAINLGVSLLSPVPLMTLPALVAVAVAAGQRGGPGAALGAALGGLGTLLVTAAFLQVLLAVLDEVLRREAVRYVATAVMTLFFVGLQFGARLAARRLSQDVLLRFQHHELTVQQALALAGRILGRIPTVAAPAAIATGALEGRAGPIVLGLAATAALLMLGVLPGAALMRHTVRGGESPGTRRARTAQRRGGGAFGVGAGVLPRGIGLMLGRELRLTARNPQRLMSVLMAPLVGLMFAVSGRGAPAVGVVAFTLALLSSAVGTASLLLFAYDGPGVRSFFLLPIRPRDLLLAKNLEVLARFALQLVLAFGLLSWLVRGLWVPLTLCLLLGALAVVLVSLAIGTWVSLRHPTRARQRGLAMRGNTGWAGMAVSFGTFLGAGVLGALVWGARRLAGPAWADPVALALTGALLLAAAAVWWRSLDLNARALVDSRERLIEVLARTTED